MLHLLTSELSYLYTYISADDMYLQQ